MDDPFEVQLSSKTVFWEDLKIPMFPRALFSFKLQPEDRRKISAEFWDEHIEPWFQIAIKHDYNVHDAGIWFANGHEAALFLVRWRGLIPM